MAAGGAIVTDDGELVPELELRPSLFVDRTIALYGPSGSGKTVAIKNVLRQVQGYIEQVLVIAPTEPVNRSYEGYVDRTLIHYKMCLPDSQEGKGGGKGRGPDGGAALRFISTVYQRQEMIASVYRRANKPGSLKALYGRLRHAQRRESDQSLEDLERCRRRAIRAIRRQCGDQPAPAREKEINSRYEEMVVLFYKKCLTAHAEELWAKKGLSEDELYTLQYLNLNPRLILIFDDCAADLKPLFKYDIFRKLFYQNRHSYITVVMAFQDDSDIPPNLRKNVFISFFMNDQTCHANFYRQSNSFSKESRQKAEQVARQVYGSDQYRKVAYIRDDKTQRYIYHIRFPEPTPFRFGSRALLDLCDLVRAEGGELDEQNPFYKKFRVGS